MFDPVHNGHVDVIQRSLRLFDELIVAVVANPSKQPLFSVKERLEMIDEATSDLNNFRIVAFDGLLIDLVAREDRKSTRLNSSHVRISYAVFCLKKKKTKVQ